MTTAWIQTLTGRALFYAAPTFEPDHLWTEIAPALSRIARFAGHTDTAYSVAQHSVLMAEAALDETGDPLLAAHCLLHDAHEAFIGDRPSPAKLAEREELEKLLDTSTAKDDVKRWAVAMARVASRSVTIRLDVAIFQAAHLFVPIGDLAAKVHTYDLRALATERRDLKRPAPLPWIDEVERAQPLRLRSGSIRPWPAGVAEERFAHALTQLCPIAAQKTGRGGNHQLEGAA